MSRAEDGQRQREGTHQKDGKGESVAAYKWTEKRLVALKCLVATQGNYRKAAVLAKGEVSEDYLRDLMSRPHHAAFQERFREESEAALEALELDGDAIMDSIRQIAEGAKSESVRLKALELLGKTGALFRAPGPGSGRKIGIFDGPGLWMVERMESICAYIIEHHVPPGERYVAAAFLFDAMWHARLRLEGPEGSGLVASEGYEWGSNPNEGNG